jgi:hypothetical protein
MKSLRKVCVYRELREEEKRLRRLPWLAAERWLAGA